MGDVGSLSLGGAMGVVAVLIQTGASADFHRGMFLIEGLSVILQVGSYKLLRSASSAWRRFTTILKPWVGRIENHCALLDCGTGDGAVRSDHSEVG